MKNQFFLLSLLISIPTFAQMNAEFSEQDACDLTNLTHEINIYNIGTYSDIYTCTYNACLYSQNPYSSKYDGLPTAEAFCGSRKTEVQGFWTADQSTFRCVPVPSTSNYLLNKYTPFEIDESKITREDRCAAVKQCWEDTKSPRQAAWAQWKMSSLYCDAKTNTNNDGKTDGAKP